MNNALTISGLTKTYKDFVLKSKVIGSNIVEE